MFWKAVLAAVWNPGKSESRQDKRVSGEQGRGSYKARAGAGGWGRPLRPGRDRRVTPLSGGAGRQGHSSTSSLHTCKCWSGCSEIKPGPQRASGPAGDRSKRNTRQKQAAC